MKPVPVSSPVIVSLSMLLAIGCGGSSDAPPALSPEQRMFGTSQVPEVLANGCEFQWTFTVPGPDGELYTDDDLQTGSVLWLPPNQSVRVHFTSSDYIYTFLQEDLKVNEMAVPGLVAETVIHVPAAGLFEIASSPLCGFPFFHADYRPMIRIGIPAGSADSLHETESHHAQ